MQIRKGTKYQICVLCQYETARIQQQKQDQELSQSRTGDYWFVSQSR